MHFLRTTTFAAVSALMLLGPLAACGDDETHPLRPQSGGTTTSTSSAGGAGGSGGQGGAGGEGGMVNLERITLSGDVTWTLTFDDEAKMNGATDCTYTRHYEAVQDDSAPWLCRDCEVIFSADVEMTAGLNDCFSQIATGMPSPTEWIGYGNGKWFRSVGGALTEQGTAVLGEQTVTTDNVALDIPANVGGTLMFEVGGVLTSAIEEGDPLHGFVASNSYSCGWPKADPPPYTGDYSIALGGIVPDGLFKDACDDVVRLHDFKGSYLMIDMSAADCPPCHNMASLEEEFVAKMKTQGIDVHVITLMAPSLTDVYGESSNELLNNWTNDFELASPVLGDRAWGLTMFSQLFAMAGSYPSWMLVDPDLNVFEAGEGFSNFDEMEAAILADAGN